MLLDRRGHPLSARERVATPRPATPSAVLRQLAALLRALPGFDRVSVGFPGVVERGVVHLASNLHPAWVGENAERRIRELTRKPTRVANDADVQGMGVIRGRGVELVITLGTGVGSALFVEGVLLPNLELGHHPFRNGFTYEEQLGDRARKDLGKRQWNRRLGQALALLNQTFNPRRIYLGGGNARHASPPLPDNVQVVANLAGLLGGIRLWDPPRARRPATRTPR